MSLLSKLKPKGPNGFGYGTTARDVVRDLDLKGKTILLTGCNSGIGHEATRALGERGAHMIGAARSMAKAETALAGLPESTPVVCELSDPASVRACVETVKALGRPLDAIVCNAGIMALPKLKQAHGVELQFFTNHMGHFLLVTGLLDALADDGRVVMVSSEAHRQAPKGGVIFDNLDGKKGYVGWRAYGQAKIANILFANELARRFEGTQKTANSLHPGVIKTNLGRHMNPIVNVALAVGNPLVLKTIPEGAATTTYLAVHPGAAGISGKYFSDCNPKRPTRDAQNSATAKRLWEASEAIAARV